MQARARISAFVSDCVYLLPPLYTFAQEANNNQSYGSKKRFDNPLFWCRCAQRTVCGMEIRLSIIHSWDVFSTSSSCVIWIRGVRRSSFLCSRLLHIRSSNWQWYHLIAFTHLLCSISFRRISRSHSHLRLFTSFYLQIIIVYWTYFARIWVYL